MMASLWFLEVGWMVIGFNFHGISQILLQVLAIHSQWRCVTVIHSTSHGNKNDSHLISSLSHTLSFFHLLIFLSLSSRHSFFGLCTSSQDYDFVCRKKRRSLVSMNAKWENLHTTMWDWRPKLNHSFVKRLKHLSYVQEARVGVILCDDEWYPPHPFASICFSCCRIIRLLVF